MPRLKLFGRRWGIASDDFVFPGGFEVFFRLVWLLFIVLAYFLAVDPVDPNTCGDHYSELNAFLVCSMVLQGIVFVNATIIMIISALGTLSVERPRRHIRVFLYVRCFLFLPEAILATFGAYYIASSAILGLDTCPIFVQAVCLLGVILSFTVLFVRMIIVQCIFDPLGASQKIRDKQRLARTVSHDSQSLNDRRRVETSNLWETRLRRLCCCFISDTEGNRNALKVNSTIRSTVIG
jgi:sn1-specific diacylglycerol lipase